MRLDIHHHFEGVLTLASADFQAQLDRLSTALNSASVAVSTRDSTIASLSTALAADSTTASVALSSAVVAEDEADVASLSSALTAAGVPPASVSESVSASVSAAA